MSDSLQPHGWYSPWNSPGQNIRVGSYSLLQGIFPIQGSNPGLPLCRLILYQLSYPECRRIDVFELWCWRRHLRVPWTARRSNWSILKEISPEYSLEGLMLKLELQYSGHLMGRTDSFEKTLMLGKIEGGRKRGHRGWDGWMASLTQWTWGWVNSMNWWWTGRPGVLQSMRLQRVGHNWATELNWTEVGFQHKEALGIISPVVRTI